MLLEIKQEHIDRAIKGDCHLCPIALALTEQYGSDATVGRTSASVGRKDFMLKDDARNFVLCFDGGVKVTPCTVELQDVS